jgi:hypothetical protein
LRVGKGGRDEGGKRGRDEGWEVKGGKKGKVKDG